MPFDPINKVSYSELTPELQELIDSKVSQVDFDNHVENETIHITAQERDYWNSIENIANSYTDNKFQTIVGQLPSDTQSIIELLNSKLDSSIFTEFQGTLATIAFTGSYNDLKDLPSNIAYSDEANHAYEADHAKEADHATNADHANTADSATDAESVNNIGVYVGATQPSPNRPNALWFDTQNRIMKCYSGGSWISTRSVWA